MISKWEEKSNKVVISFYQTKATVLRNRVRQLVEKGRREAGKTDCTYSTEACQTLSVFFVFLSSPEVI